MNKFDENMKKMTNSDTNNNSNNDLNTSTRPTSFQKKYRKDAKGNLILKKKINIKKTKHHVYFIDKINPNKNLVEIINVESYKKYNLDGEELIEDDINIEGDNTINNDNDNNKQQLIQENNIIKSNYCCVII